MLSIRLSRVGKRKQPIYRLIVTDRARDPWGKALEILGNFNPRTQPATLNFKVDRIKSWLSKGAQATDTVWNLLVDQKIVQGEKRRKVRITARRQEKIDKERAANKKAEPATAPVETPTPVAAA
jgi:small subunit ribosomal protein S16